MTKVSKDLSIIEIKAMLFDENMVIMHNQDIINKSNNMKLIRQSQAKINELSNILNLRKNV